jgi:transposase InsO family protein
LEGVIEVDTLSITAVIDCCDRSIVGWRVSKSGKAKVAAAALEDALIKRRSKPGLKRRSDNGLIFGAEDFHKVVSLCRNSPGIHNALYPGTERPY